MAFFYHCTSTLSHLHLCLITMLRPKKFKIRLRKSARYGHKAVCTKAKRTAPMLQKIKSDISLTVKLNKHIRIIIYTNKTTHKIYFLNCLQKSFVNDRKFKSIHKHLQVLIAPKIKNSRFLKKKDSFPNDFPRIKKPKRNHSNSLIHVHRKIPNISGYQIFFLPKLETSNTSIILEVLTAAEVERLNISPNLHHNKTNTFNSVDQFKERCKLIRDLRKKEAGERYHQITEMQREAEKIPIVDPNIFFPFLKDYLHKHEQKQYAFAIFKMKHSKNIVTPGFEPDYENDKHKHSEPLLCEEIEKFLHNCGILVESILVYTFNSPCPDCFSLLVEKAFYWRSKYGFSTTVTFTKFYGLTSKEIFQSITHLSPDMSGPCGVFYEARRECEREPFTLDDFKAGDIFRNIGKLEINERAGCNETIKSCVAELKNLAKNSVCFQEHLRCGNNTINSFKFPPTIQKDCVQYLSEAWSDLVHSSAIKIIRNYITKKFNVAVVEVINHELKSVCGNNCPLKLYQIPLDL